jgi:hypothetical protein
LVITTTTSAGRMLLTHCHPPMVLAQQTTDIGLFALR